MKILSAEFITSAVDALGYPDTGLPEIAFIGRSNVGKSSLLNNLVRRKRLAKTSSVPGKTQLINFYRVNDVYGLVDLPGYGFTKVPVKVSVKWRQFIDEYFRTRETLVKVIQLIDIRHPPTNMDTRVNFWLRETMLLGGVIAVKADKLTRNHQNRSLQVIRKTLQLNRDIPLICHSSQSGQGRDEVWELIRGAAVFDDEPSG